MVKSPKKLIEVALPLDAINESSVNEKNPFLKGHPRSLHLWWARRPLAAARAVLFAQLVNDPGGDRGWYPGKSKERAKAERKKLFEIIEELSKWENLNNKQLLEEAQALVRQSWSETCRLNEGNPEFDPKRFPPFLDPFSGGGAIPLEAQRLGLEPVAIDLNPVSVCINKAMIEIPSLFSNVRAPICSVHIGQESLRTEWEGRSILAEDIKRYGAILQERLRQKLSPNYPRLNGVVPIVWLWARTIKSPSPQFSGVEVPLIRSYVLSSKKGNEYTLEPHIDAERKIYSFTVRKGPPTDIEAAKMGTRRGGRGTFFCIFSGSPIDSKYIKAQAKAQGFGYRLLAVVVQQGRSRTFADASEAQEEIALSCSPAWRPLQEMAVNSRHLTPSVYGLTAFSSLFTNRQLVALTTYSDLIAEIHSEIEEHARESDLPNDHRPLHDLGAGPKAYADAICFYLTLALSQYSRYHATTAIWNATNFNVAHTFGRQAIPMTWDFAESNPLDGPLTFQTSVGWVASALDSIRPSPRGTVIGGDAAEVNKLVSGHYVISTDPPYYDNVPYADLSDFFYVWLRPNGQKIFPEVFATMLTPKVDELVADPSRHGSKKEAESFFLENMTKAFSNIALISHEAFPVTIYYAYKQSDRKDEKAVVTGWEIFLQAVINAGYVVTGTWPISTEDASRLRSQASNALASSIVLVCRRRKASAGEVSRKQFQRELRQILPEALDTMINGAAESSPIRPVDLTQAAMGPGISVFSKYTAVIGADGARTSVHDALQMIGREVEEHLNPESSGYDPDTLFCASWFAQYGWSSGVFGDANTIAQAKGTSVDGVKASGTIDSGGGKVKLLKWREYPVDWDPRQDHRTPVWEALHHMIRALNQEGESAAGQLLARMPERSESIRQLAYHLYTLCERKKWAEDARPYNELIASWHAIVAASHEVGQRGTQMQIDLET